ncbi:EAL domain-containing protein [Primorskyibacter sp. 2E107]|uniref:sensor domain-containing phosphodiesterase n=1 Tax=Primorskyibacter sp. 2E107 TaxID=3403458 RepID=UPI003AF8C022
MISHHFRDAITAEIGNRPEDLRWKKRRILKTLRELFEMDAAFISRFTATERVFDEVDVDGTQDAVRADQLRPSPLNESYCSRVARRQVPNMLTDARLEPSVADIAATHSLPVGGHISVPIEFSTGRIYGMLCAFSRQPKPDLKERDLAFFTLCADLLARDMETMAQHSEDDGASADILQDALGNATFDFHLQPIRALPDRTALGYELLTRFPDRLGMTSEVFQRAKHLDMVASLEEIVARGSGTVLDLLPPGAFLTINFSTSSIEDLDIAALFRPADRHRVVIELTEHERVADYASFGTAIRALRALGFRIAVDDVGAGYSSLRHVLVLKPDFIKLDRSLISGIDTSVEQQNLVSSLRAFAQLQGAGIIAEGIETQEELAELERLGVDAAQGFLLGRPQLYTEVLAGTQNRS